MPITEVTKAVQEVVEAYNEDEVVTLDQVASLLPNLNRHTVNNSLLTLVKQGHLRRIEGRKAMWTRTLIHPVDRPVKLSEEQRIQAALLALVPGGKVAIKNLMAINEWVEASKKLLRSIK